MSIRWQAVKRDGYWIAQYRIDSDMGWSEFPRRFAEKHDAEFAGWVCAVLESEPSPMHSEVGE